MTPYSTNTPNGQKDDFLFDMTTAMATHPLPPVVLPPIVLPPLQSVPSTKAKNAQRIPRFRPSVVSFGAVYDNMQQFDHFSREYHSTLLKQVPNLVPLEPIRPTRVGVIPSSIKRSPIVTTSVQETTTLTRKLEPPTRHSKKNSSTTVFSGPHYLPEKYSVKPLLKFRQKYFVPSYTDEDQSRYYMAPDVNHYFQAALQDGSYFESFTEYKPSDPINFRHAYNLDQFVNILEPVIKNLTPQSPVQRQQQQQPSTSLPIPPILRNPVQPIVQSAMRPSSLTTTKNKEEEPARKWHKPVAISEDEEEEESDSDSDGDSMILMDKKKDKGKGRAMDPKPKVQPRKDLGFPSSSSASSPSSSSSSSTSSYSDHSITAIPNKSALTNKNADNQQTRLTIKIPLKRTIEQSSPTSPPTLITATNNNKKQRTLNSLIPTKKNAIEDLRRLGKFIKAWKQKDAEVCCVCYEDVTTASNPLVYCDNALCEVIVHKNCYRIRSQIGDEQNWYCDRCRPVNGVSKHRDVTCVVCPSITGAFCKLSTPFNGIEWVHMICAKALTGPGGFIYQAKTQDYKMSIRHHIPIQRFDSTCIYCSDPIFADFGAKVKCHYCPRSFHVTCAEKNGYWCFHTDAILACSNHAIHTTAKSSPQRLALVYDKWLSKRDAFYLVSYEKTPDKFKMDAWKQTLKHGVDVGDNIDETYQIFFDHIASYKESDTKRMYSRYVKHLLNEFCKEYTTTGLLNVNGLFLKKNFYHSEKYSYTPALKAFYMCDDDTSKDDEEEETEEEELPMVKPTKKKPISVEKFAKLSPPPQITAPPTKTSSSAESASKTQKKKKETVVVIPSDDLVCTICLQHELPKTTFEKLNFDDSYLKHLEETKHLRKLGHTGSGGNWDPRVFIECSMCKSRVHCGCPSPPIKKYPQKFQSFVCIHCDTKGEEMLPLQHDMYRRRGTTGINYKV